MEYYVAVAFMKVHSVYLCRIITELYLEEQREHDRQQEKVGLLSSMHAKIMAI